MRGVAASLQASVGRDALAKQALEEEGGIGGGGKGNADNLSIRLALANHLLRRGKYESAADAYCARMLAATEARRGEKIAVGLVWALSYYDPEADATVQVAREELPKLLEEDEGETGGSGIKGTGSFWSRHHCHVGH